MGLASASSQICETNQKGDDQILGEGLATVVGHTYSTEVMSHWLRIYCEDDDSSSRVLGERKNHGLV